MVGGSRGRRESPVALKGPSQSSKTNNLLRERHKEKQSSKTVVGSKSRTSASTGSRHSRLSAGSKRSGSSRRRNVTSNASMVSKSSNERSAATNITRSIPSSISSRYLWQEALKNPSSNAFLRPPSPSMPYTKRKWVIEQPREELPLRIPIESEDDAGAEPWSTSLPQLSLSKKIYFDSRTSQLKKADQSIKSQTSFKHGSGRSTHRARRGVPAKIASTNQRGRSRLPSHIHIPLRSCLKRSESRNSGGDSGVTARVRFYNDRGTTEMTRVSMTPKERTKLSSDTQKSSDGTTKSQTNRLFGEQKSPIETHFCPMGDLNTPDGMFRRVDISKIRNSRSVRKSKVVPPKAQSASASCCVPQLKQSHKATSASAGEMKVVQEEPVGVDAAVRSVCIKIPGISSHLDKPSPQATNTTSPETSEHRENLTSNTDLLLSDTNTDRIKVTSRIDSNINHKRIISSNVQFSNAILREKQSSKVKKSTISAHKEKKSTSPTQKEKKSMAPTFKEEKKKFCKDRAFKTFTDHRITNKKISKICAETKQPNRTSKRTDKHVDFPRSTDGCYFHTVESTNDETGSFNKATGKCDNSQASRNKWVNKTSSWSTNSVGISVSTLADSMDGKLVDPQSKPSTELPNELRNKINKAQAKHSVANKHTQVKTTNKVSTKPMQGFSKSNRIGKGTCNRSNKSRTHFHKDVSTPDGIKIGKKFVNSGRDKHREQKDIIMQSTVKSYTVRTTKPVLKKLTQKHKDTTKTNKSIVRQVVRIEDVKTTICNNKLDINVHDSKTQKSKDRIFDKIKLQLDDKLNKFIPHKNSSKHTASTSRRKYPSKTKHADHNRQVHDSQNKPNLSYRNTSKNIYGRHPSQTKLNSKEISPHNLFQKITKINQVKINVGVSQCDDHLSRNTQGPESNVRTQTDGASHTVSTRGKINEVKSNSSKVQKRKFKGDQTFLALTDSSVNIKKRSYNQPQFHSRNPTKLNPKLRTSSKADDMNAINIPIKKPVSPSRPERNFDKESPNNASVKKILERNKRLAQVPVPSEMGTSVHKTGTSSIYDSETCENLRLLRASRESDWDQDNNPTQSKYFGYSGNSYEAEDETDNDLSDFVTTYDENFDKRTGVDSISKRFISKHTSIKDSRLSSMETVKGRQKKKRMPSTKISKTHSSVTSKSTSKKLPQSNSNATPRLIKTAKTNATTKSKATSNSSVTLQSSSTFRTIPSTKSFLSSVSTATCRSAAGFRRDGNRNTSHIDTAQVKTYCKNKFQQKCDSSRDMSIKRTRSKNFIRSRDSKNDKHPPTIGTTPTIDVPTVFTEPSKTYAEYTNDTNRKVSDVNVTVFFSKNTNDSDKRILVVSTDNMLRHRINNLQIIGKRQCSNIRIGRQSSHPLYDPLTGQYRPPNHTAQRAEEREQSKKVISLRQTQSTRETSKEDDSTSATNISNVLGPNMKNEFPNYADNRTA